MRLALRRPDLSRIRLGSATLVFRACRFPGLPARLAAPRSNYSYALLDYLAT